MNNNNIVKNSDTNKKTFVIAWVSSIVLILMLCFLGVNSSMKGTYSADGCSDDKEMYKGNDGDYCVSKNESVQKVESDTGLTYYVCRNGFSEYKPYKYNMDNACQRFGENWFANSFSEDSVDLSFPDGLNLLVPVRNWICFAHLSECGEKIDVDSGKNINRCYYIEKTNYYVWINEDSAGEGYVYKPFLGSKVSCESKNTKIAKFWVGSDQIDEIPCYLEPSNDRYDGTCKISGIKSVENDNFLGWNIDSSCDNPEKISSVDISDDVNYYACFDAASGGSSSNNPSAGDGGSSDSSTGSGGSYGESELPDIDDKIQPIKATFDYNDGSGREKSATCTPTSKYGECEVTFPNITHREFEEYGDEYQLLGWDTQHTCGQYTTEKEVSLEQSFKFYACWKKVSSDNSSSNLPSGDEGSSNSGNSSSNLPSGDEGSSNSGNSSNPDNGVDSDGNTTESPQTGEIAIALIWFGGLLAIGYSIYYFREIKQQ